MSENKVLAVVEGKEIKQSDVDALLGSIDPQRAAQFQSEEGKKSLLQELVNQEMFFLDAKKNNLDEDPDFKKELDKIKDNYLKQYSINKVLKEAVVSEDEVKNFYEENKEQFQSPEEVKCSHILVDDEVSLKALKNEIESGEKTFEEAAKENSKCPSKDNGGDLGFFSKGKMVPEFEEAAFKLDKGEISSPVKTQFGYHLIKVSDKKEAGNKSFDEVKNQLTQNMLMQKQQGVYTSKVEELKKDYKVEINI